MLLQLLNKVLDQCNPLQLGSLQASCNFFARGTPAIALTAQKKMAAIPRAKGLSPRTECAPLALLACSMVPSHAPRQVHRPLCAGHVFPSCK